MKTKQHKDKTTQGLLCIRQSTIKNPLSIQGISTFLWLSNPHNFIIKKIAHCKNWLPRHVDHKAKLSTNWLRILVLMNSMLLNTRWSSTKPNTWIVVIFASFTYSEMLQDRIVKWKMILHILVKGLIVLGGPKAALALLLIIILNTDFCTPSIDIHTTPQEPHVQQPLSFLGSKEIIQNIQMGVEWFIKFFKQPIMRMHNT